MMNSIVKQIVCIIPLVREYRRFKRNYYEVASFWKFMKYYFFPSLIPNIYWPTHKNSVVRGRIIIGKCARVGHRPGCYIQGRGKVFIGDYAEIAPNCVIISGNHGLQDHSVVDRRETIVGDYCWLASSSNILAGVVLGPRTVVGAGSVVTKSFPEGYCVIAGNPARLIKKLDKDSFVPEKLEHEYYGYVPAAKFPAYYRKHLSKIIFEYDLSKVTSNPLFHNKPGINE